MVKNNWDRALLFENAEQPDIKLAEYVYMRSDNKKELQYCTLSNDATDYEVNTKTINYRNLNFQHKYTRITKSINPLIENKARLLIKPQYMKQRKNLFTSPNRDEQIENVYQSIYSKQPTFNVRLYNLMPKPGTKFARELRNNMKVNKRATAFEPPESFNNNSKIGNTSKFMDADAELENDYLLDSANILRQTSVSPNDTTSGNVEYQSFIASSLFFFIPRFDYNLRKLKEKEYEFNPYSTAYKFVSNFDHLFDTPIHNSYSAT